MKGKEKTRMLTGNDKIRSSNRGVEKAHCKHQGCYLGHEKFLFPTIKNIKMFRVECIAYNVDWPIKSSHFFCTWPFGAVWGGGSFKFLGFWCLFHVPIMFCKFPKTIPQRVPNSTALLYHNLS
jgi:hypothetical protein